MKVFQVIADRLNLRAEPRLTGSILQTLQKGEELTFLSASGDGYWFKVETNDDVTGWVSQKYLRATAHQELLKPDEEFPWMTFAFAELGTKEFNGDADNPRIVQYLNTTSLSRSVAAQDETPWCSAFVNWCVESAGIAGTDSAWARNWLHWGKPLSSPRRGCIVVFSRNQAGHVGFYLGKQGKNLKVLGGNQGDAVTIASYPAERVLGYRII